MPFFVVFRCRITFARYYLGMRIANAWQTRMALLRTSAGIVLAALTFFVFGCGRNGGPPQRPPATVTVIHPLQQEVADWDDFPGRLQSPESTNIQARVSGLITSAPFKEGAFVQKGDVLFVIDQQPFKADLDAKKATVAKDVAQVDLTAAQLARSKRLLATHVIDQQDYDISDANYLQAQAQLQADQAAQETSELNMEWSTVRAPIKGLVSKIYVTKGNVITGGVGNGTLLTTLVSVDPVYCYVPVPERLFLQYKAYARQSGSDVRNVRIGCSIQLEDETRFVHKGVIDFIDNTVDPATGTIQMRGVFTNPDDYLTPGLFARMQIEGVGPYKALLVPDEAVGTDQNERYLTVVDATDTVQTKRVELGRLFGAMRVIEQGIAVTDRVVVNGLQMAIPGTKVNVMEGAPLQPVPQSAGAAATGTAGS